MAKCCAGCGFLAVRNIETRNLEEVEFESRQIGNMRGRYHYMPICFVMAANFGEEIEELRHLPENETRQNEMGEVIWPKWDDLRKTVFSKERPCESFTRWQQGFTPKEHREMIDHQAMVKWQAEREDTDRLWREKQEKIRSRTEWGRYIFLALFGIIAVVIGVILGHFIK